jgi:methionyl-tRNA synthetase
MNSILVTTALPYANSKLHLGHILEHLMTDIWVRYQKMEGRTCLALCADDTHGAPVMISARKQGISPEELIGRTQKDHIQDLGDFEIVYDFYGSTHSEENRQLADQIYHLLKSKNAFESRSVEQFYCLSDGMFLPDRFVKGACPLCGAEDQYGDSCDRCGGVYSSLDLKAPRCALCTGTPEKRHSNHVFFRLKDEEEFLKAWIPGRVPPTLEKKLTEWMDEGLKDWCISRDAPYFGFEIPDEPGKYYYVWFDAPIGYIAATWQWCKEHNEDWKSIWGQGSDWKICHNIGKDIVYFHSLFWPSVLKKADLTTPSQIWVHGMLTLNGEKMSKSKGTFINARTYLNALPGTHLRYYLACKLTDTPVDFDLSQDDFLNRVNADLVGKITNIASRCAQLLQRHFKGELGALEAGAGEALFLKGQEKAVEIGGFYEARQFARGMIAIRELADETNGYLDQAAPWKLVAQDPGRTQCVLTTALNLFRLMAIYLTPVIPSYSKKAGELFLESEPYIWKSAALKVEHRAIQPYEPLASRITLDQWNTMMTESQPTPPPEATPPEPLTPAEPLTPEITIDEFFKVDLRVAKVLEAKAVPKADKLLELTLDVGALGQRTVFSGIKEAYTPESLTGKYLVVVANLKARQMKFGLSQGMILAAGPGGKDVWLLEASSATQPGMRIG